MHRCAVIGSPVAHSRSPVLHRAAYTALGLADWSYERVELSAAELPGWLATRDGSWRGLSVTMPLKQPALAAADGASELAATLGAANTLLRGDAGWYADNTDVAGLLGALGEAGIDEARVSGTASVVGAGGTAAAAVAALGRLDVAVVSVLVRDAVRAGPLLELIERLGMRAELHDWPSAAELSAGESAPLSADLVISTVPASAGAALAGHPWRSGQTVVDVTYDPWPSALGLAARRDGARAIDGAAVLLWQAVAQVGVMTGHRAPVDAMRAALFPGGTLAQP